MSTKQPLQVEVNGEHHQVDIEPRLLLSDLLRHELGLTGTHVGCEQGACGACTVQVDGLAVRACLMLAVQADGAQITTVEALGVDDPEGMSILQHAFRETHGLQCGFCTPGFLMSLEPLVAAGKPLSRDEIREAISSNLCRCTGYHTIVDAVELALAQVAEQRAQDA